MKKDRPCSKILKIIHIGDVVIAIYDWLLIKLLSSVRALIVNCYLVYIV